MKKILLLFLMLCFALPSLAAKKETNYVINTLENGTKLICTGEKYKGSIEEYDDEIEDYYTFKDGKIYSPNLYVTFKDQEDKEKKVSKLKITKKKIKFKDRLYTWGALHYKFVTIDRKTGEYHFKAKKQYTWTWYRRSAKVLGTCSYNN